mgnify:CR=1 FL=1
MKKTLLSSIVFSLLFFQINGQFTLTDEMDLGEDRSSHNYQEYSPLGMTPFSIGVYDCNQDSAVNIGMSGVNDSITFDLAVTPNADVVLIKWKYAWFNSGGNGQFTKMVIENSIEESMFSPAPTSIGSDPIGCNLDSNFIYLTNMSAFTADGSIKIKIFDPYSGFVGNSSISRVNAYVSDGNVGISENSLTNQFKLYPNPFNNALTIKTDIDLNKEHYTIRLIDALGKEFKLKSTKNGSMGKANFQLDHLLNGIYFVMIHDKRSGELIWHENVIKK